jgi:hypothetical protein
VDAALKDLGDVVEPMTIPEEIYKVYSRRSRRTAGI